MYKCSLTSAECEPFIFDSSGNTNDETKDNQWLGASTDGHEEDRFVVI